MKKENVFNLMIGGTLTKNRVSYKKHLDMAVEEYEGKVPIPKVVYFLPELEEYTRDFLKEVDGDINCSLILGRSPYLQIYFFRNSKNEYIDCHGFSVDINFIDLQKLDIPDLGNYIFDMWNAYVSVTDNVEYYWGDVNVTQS